MKLGDMPDPHKADPGKLREVADWYNVTPGDYLLMRSVLFHSGVFTPIHAGAFSMWATTNTALQQNGPYDTLEAFRLLKRMNQEQAR